MKKVDGTKWRITKVTKQELANVLWIFRARGELFGDDPTIKAIATLPPPHRQAGDPVLDLKYLDNVMGEPALHKADEIKKVFLVLLDAGQRTKCSLVNCKLHDSEGCHISIKSTWREAMADAATALEEALGEVKETHDNE